MSCNIFRLLFFVNVNKLIYFYVSYTNLAGNIDNFLGCDFYRKIANDTNIPPEDVQKYILATSNFAKEMQTDINNYVTKDRINNASFRQKLDPIKKNNLRRQNPLELVFEDISTFDAENPIVRSVLRELEDGKKLPSGDLVKKVPGPPGIDFAIRNGLNRLKERKKNTSPPQPPPSFSFNFPSLPPPPADSYILPPPPTNQIFSPQPALPPPSSSFPFPTQPTVPSKFYFGSQTQTLTREKEETKNKVPLDDNKIDELPEIPKIELGDRLANVLEMEGGEILEDDFLKAKELEDKNIEEIKEDYEFDKLKMHLMKELFHYSLIFSVVGNICQKVLNVPASSCHLMTKTLDLLIFFALINVKILRQITVY